MKIKDILRLFSAKEAQKPKEVPRAEADALIRDTRRWLRELEILELIQGPPEACGPLLKELGQKLGILFGETVDPSLLKVVMGLNALFHWLFVERFLPEGTAESPDQGAMSVLSHMSDERKEIVFGLMAEKLGYSKETFIKIMEFVESIENGEPSRESMH